MGTLILMALAICQLNVTHQHFVSQSGSIDGQYVDDAWRPGYEACRQLEPLALARQDAIEKQAARDQLTQDQRRIHDALAALQSQK